MSEPPFRRVAILGVGLIGGSLGLAARGGGLAARVVGYSRSPETRRRAVELGALDEAADSPAACVAGAELVCLATPVDVVVPLLAEIAPWLQRGCLVTDAGSTKAGIVAAAAALDLRGAVFVGGHPLAGSEQAGVEHARADLFAGMAWAICPTERSSPAGVDQLIAVVEALGARPVIVGPSEHDRAVAVTSHLPHLIAMALVELTAARAADGLPTLDLAAGSWAGATRVAASDAALWRAILAANREPAIEAVEAFAARLTELAELLRAGDDAALETAWDRARQIKRGLPRQQG